MTSLCKTKQKRKVERVLVSHGLVCLDRVQVMYMLLRMMLLTSDH